MQMLTTRKNDVDGYAYGCRGGSDAAANENAEREIEDATVSADADVDNSAAADDSNTIDVVADRTITAKTVNLGWDKSQLGGLVSPTSSSSTLEQVLFNAY